MRARQMRPWLTAAIVFELLATGLIGLLIWMWPVEEFSVAVKTPNAVRLLDRDQTVADSLPSLALAMDAAKKAIHRPLFDRPPVPITVKSEAPKPPKKARPAIKLIGTIADPTGNRGIFETTPEHTEVRRAGERFEQLPTVMVKQIDLEKAVLQADSEEFEVSIATPAVEGRTP